MFYLRAGIAYRNFWVNLWISALPRQHISRQQCGDMPNVQRAVCVRPGSPDENVPHFFSLFPSFFS
jgi:hypothetical protein